MKHIVVHISLLCFGLIVWSCQKDLPNQPKPNQLPSTRLWLTSSDTLNETSSRQHAYWYGEDPDGYISGFLFTTPETLKTSVVAFPDTFNYSWTTKTDSVIALPLLKQRSLFTIIVRAVDNTFKESSLLPEGAVVRLVPQPYWDKNVNGMFDAGDIALTSLLSSIDSKSANQLLPIRNTPPRVFFSVNPIDSSTYQQPETTFTVATFSWYATDIDGDQTISGFRIALNDTGTADRWFTVNNSVKLVTLMVPRSASDSATTDVHADVYTGTFPNMQFRGKIPGLKLNAANVLYLQAKDVAGEYSPTMTMPSTPATRRWYVKKPKSRMLFVSDYNQSDRVAAQAMLSQTLEQALPGKSFSNFDLLDVGFGLTSAEKQNQLVLQKYGSYVPVNMNPQLIQTLKLYDVVLWFSDLYPSYLPAQIGLFNYTLTGGKVIFSTTFPANVVFAELRALNDFAPIDSVSTDANSSTTVHTNADNRMPQRTKVLPLVSGYPELAFDTTTSIHNFNWRRIYKRTDAQYIYRLDSSKFYNTGGQFRYAGTPEIACIDNNKRFLLFALPIHRVNGGQFNLAPFFKHVIQNEFGLN